MNFVKYIRVRQKRTKARFGAEIDRLSAIFSTRKISRVSVAKGPPTEGDESLQTRFLLSGQWAYRIHSKGDPQSTTRVLSLRWMGRPYNA